MRVLAGISIVFFLPGCATLNESMSLGAAMGTIVGGGAMAFAQSTSSGNKSFGNVALAAGL